MSKVIEEYALGPGHPDTLDGYGAWCRWRNEQEATRKMRRTAEELERARGHA